MRKIKITGVEGVLNLKVQEIKLLILMAERQDHGGGVELTPRVKNHIMSALDIKERMIYIIMRGLEDKGAIKRVDNYGLVNPEMLYVFKEAEYKDRVKAFKNGIEYEQEF